MVLHVKRLLPIWLQLHDLIRQYPEHKQYILNACLIWVGARKAHLIEGRTPENMHVLQLAMAIMNASSKKVQIRYNPNTDMLYTNPALDKLEQITDKQRGQLLGFSCAGHDYGNINIDRIRVNVVTRNGISYFAQYCVASSKNVARQMSKLKRFAQKKAQQFNQVFILFNEYAIPRVVLDLAYPTKIRNLDNNVFIREHIRDYGNDIENNWTELGRFNERTTWEELKENDWVEFFKFIYWVSTAMNVFEGLKYNATKEKQIAEFETQLLQTTELLQFPYKRWIETTVFQQLLQQQPTFIQQTFAETFK